jgi:hypothetical protein
VSFGLAKTDHVGGVGDSITSGATGVQDRWWVNGNFLPAIKQTQNGGAAASSTSYANTSGTLPAPGPYTTWGFNGQSGRAITDVSPNIMAVMDAGATAAVIELGVNDAAAGTTNPTLTTAVTKIHDDLATAGIHKMLWIGPFSHGEHWPSGAGSGNDIDVAIDRIDALLASLMAGFGAGYDYVSWRAVFNTWEPILNPSNLASGIFTSDGTHPQASNPSAYALLIAAIRAKIVLL